MPHDDPSQFRISVDDRHAVAEVLRKAAGEGRIDLVDLDELDERLEATYSAKTYADLIPITEDLPTSNLVSPRSTPPERTSPSALVTGRSSETHFAIMSGIDRRGHWVVPERTTVVALVGGANLDLREAQFPAREVTFVVNAIMGGADIVVPPNVHVVVDGIGIMGGFNGPSAATRPSSLLTHPRCASRASPCWAGSASTASPHALRSRRGRHTSSATDLASATRPPEGLAVRFGSV